MYGVYCKFELLPERIINTAVKPNNMQIGFFVITHQTELTVSVFTPRNELYLP